MMAYTRSPRAVSRVSAACTRARPHTTDDVYLWRRPVRRRARNARALAHCRQKHCRQNDNWLDIHEFVHPCFWVWREACVQRLVRPSLLHRPRSFCCVEKLAWRSAARSQSAATARALTAGGAAASARDGLHPGSVGRPGRALAARVQPGRGGCPFAARRRGGGPVAFAAVDVLGAVPDPLCAARMSARRARPRHARHAQGRASPPPSPTRPPQPRPRLDSGVRRGARRRLAPRGSSLYQRDPGSRGPCYSGAGASPRRGRPQRRGARPSRVQSAIARLHPSLAPAPPPGRHIASSPCGLRRLAGS
jgi:hypothetical protein